MTMQAQVHTITIHITRGQQHLKLDFTTDHASGLEIKQRAGSTAADGLYHKVHGSTVEVTDSESVPLKDGEQFTIVPNGTVS